MRVFDELLLGLIKLVLVLVFIVCLPVLIPFFFVLLIASCVEI